MKDPEIRAHVLMSLATILIATSFPVGAAITHSLDPLVLTLLRFSVAALLFGPIVALRYGLSWPGWRALAGYAVISACLVGFFWGMFAALRLTSVLNTATIFTLIPAITAAFSAMILRERLQPVAGLALSVGLVGAVWVVFRGNLDAFLALDLGKGDGIFLAACFGMAAYSPILKRLHRGEPMPVVTFWTFVTGVGWLLLISGNRIADVDWSAISWQVYGGIAWLAVFTTLVTFFIYQSSVAVIGPTRVMSYTYLNPVLVLLVGLGFGEALPPVMTWPGLVLVVVATVILQRTRPAADS
jgi:drug/metabolite transporter (DMT)-like permease